VLKKWSDSVSCAAIVLILASGAEGQTNSAIAGLVKDTTGAVLPGVTVEASSPALIEKVRRAVTDNTGQYKIIELQPGNYAVTFTLPGFSTVRRQGIELTSGFTASVNADLKLGDISETITVTGESPVVDTQNTVKQRVITRDVIDSVPSGGKTFAAIGMLIPGARVSGLAAASGDVGGTSGSANQRLRIHGGRDSDSVNLVDGMSIGVLASNGSVSFMVFPDGNVEEINLQIGAHSAEMETGGVRTNVIPKSGGNLFKGTFSGNFTNSSLQSNNLSDDLIARGLRTADKTDYLSDFNPSMGGPILRDKIWFYGGYRNWRTVTLSTVYPDTDPTDWKYVADTSKPPVPNDQLTWNLTGRVTWQATARNRVAMNLGYDQRCDCHSFMGGTTMPEASVLLHFPSRLVQGTWVAPVTNRFLVEAGASYYYAIYDGKPQPGAVGPSARELSSGFEFRSRSSPGVLNEAYQQNRRRNVNYRASASYVTGTHALKVGLQLNPGRSVSYTESLTDYTVTLLNGVPSRVDFLPFPQESTDKMRKLALFAQDQWTVKRFTLTGGLRFDWLPTSYEEVRLPATRLLPERNFPAADVLNWKDLNPRMGAAFDLFGNGRTALKVSLSRYVQLDATDQTKEVNPANAIAGHLVRNWTDTNGDFIPQGNPLNPLVDGELGPSTNVTFGKPVLTLRFDPEWGRGWRVHGNNWETSASIQHELLPRVSVDAGYFRRWYGKFTVNDNRLVAPTDYDPFCVTAPLDSRLPGGGGQQICGLYDIRPAKLGLVDTLRTSASNYGEQSEYWHGVDVTLNARPGNGAVLQGGVNIGRAVTDNCDVVTKIDNPSTRFCHRKEPFLADIKFLGSFTLPARIQVGATFQSLPAAGTGLAANFVATNAQVRPTLGRDLASGPTGTVTVNLIEPGTMILDRLNQIDLRVARPFSVGPTSLKAMVDLYNMMNANPVLGVNQTYGTNGASWLVPTRILPGRIVKFGVQWDF
jgi:hypothetical protein